MKEMNKFRNDIIPNFTECKEILFSTLINKYDDLNKELQKKSDSLSWLNKNVFFIFYEKANSEYQLNNEEEAKYYLDRSLQYNPVFPDAILLKLNKLLDKNRFQECLSVLNTLYYETELDDEQEKQAIVFTDKFYDKLYKTGDSLLKMEHAAEALQLFEILEVFCQNLPTAYCNDDYYHGILNSKTGIYDSYLAIAKVAEKRENVQIAERFYNYAEEYLENNPHLKTYEPRTEVRIENGEWRIENGEWRKEEEEDIEEDIVEEIDIETQTLAPPPSPAELKEQYDKMVLQALGLCIKEEFSESYEMFVEAKKLEDCRCFDTDFRVDLMINELSKILP